MISYFKKILAGELATQFAVEMGFKEETLTTPTSKQMWLDWRNKNCQPNFWKVVLSQFYNLILKGGGAGFKYIVTYLRAM